MTTMQILGWKAEGLRCPDHEIDCTDPGGNPYRVTLIQMPNGTGKTTTLELLRAALSGSAAKGSWNKAKVREHRKRDSDTEIGTFEVRLLLDGRRVTITMLLDFESGTVTYKTTRSEHGQEAGFEPPAAFRRFMNDTFVKFFVFDGELAQHLLDPQQVQAEAVIESLFQINTLRNIQAKVEEYWTEKTRGLSAKGERGLKQRDNKVNNLRERLEFLQKHQAKLEKRHDVVVGELEKHRKRYDEEIKREEERAERLKAAQESVHAAETKVNSAAAEVLDQMRGPHALSPVLAKAMMDLKSGLDRVKLPDSAAREFFQELAEEDECVCGRPIDDHVRGVIRARAVHYLGSNDVGFLNSMKNSISEAIGNSYSEAEFQLREQLEHLGSAVSRHRTAGNQYEALQVEVEADPIIKQAADQIKSLEKELEEISRDFKNLKSKRDIDIPDQHVWSIPVIEKRLEEAEQRLAEATQTVELKEKRDVLVRILEDAHRRARKLITEEITTEANKRIAELIPHNRLELSGIGRSLELKGQEGGSVGENLSVAYAFLSTLFYRSEHQLPFVVDSPAGPIDLAVRPKVGELVPKLTNQFIAFTISSEREGFVPKLKQASDGEAQFITLFRKQSSPLDVSAREIAGHVETADGLLVEGESFFNSFQLDQQEV